MSDNGSMFDSDSGSDYLDSPYAYPGYHADISAEFCLQLRNLFSGPHMLIAGPANPLGKGVRIRIDRECAWLWYCREC